MTQPAGAITDPARRPQKSRWRRTWRWLKRLLLAGFFVLLGVLLVSQARHILWNDVLTALHDFPARKLWTAAAFAGFAHLIYASYDLLGRAWTRHRLGRGKVLAITFVTYAFNLNLGTLIGGFALRYRLYSRFGLGMDDITRVLGLAVMSNWLGYLVLGGTVFAFGVVLPPAGWPIDMLGVRWLGIALLLVAAAYVLSCACLRRRDWWVRGHHVAVPPLRLALQQLALSCAHWLSVSAILYMLLQPGLPYAVVLSTLLIAAVAGVIVHVPAGLGVIEAVFIALLGARVPAGQLIAALLVFRALFYLVPLALATAMFVALEARAKRDSQAAIDPVAPKASHADAGTLLADHGHPAS